jgi:hypothetical protein
LRKSPSQLATCHRLSGFRFLGIQKPRKTTRAGGMD